jgi:hypothetical protein
MRPARRRIGLHDPPSDRALFSSRRAPREMSDSAPMRRSSPAPPRLERSRIMPNTVTATRLRRRPLAATLAFAIASAGGFGIASGARTAPEAPRHREPVAIERFFPPHRPEGGPIVTVTNCNDSGPGSLREAYFNAVDGTFIDLTQLTCSTISLTTGALTDSPSAARVTLQGPGKYALTIEGNYADRVLVHNGSEFLIANYLTIKGGSYHGPYGGGCVYSSGDFGLQYGIITGCSLTSSGTDHAYGGAVHAKANAFLVASTVSDSSAHAVAANSAGGAVWGYNVGVYICTVSGSTVSGDGSHYARGGGVFAFGDAAIKYSTLSGNEAESGGGLFLFGGATKPMRIINSTISGNHASGAGGGVFAKYRPLEIYNSTIAMNTAEFDFGAGLYAYTDADIQSTIIAGNTSQDGLQASDLGGSSQVDITGANNLIVASTLPVPPDTISADPMLGPLQDNGGATMTHALLPGSPAVDHGNNVHNGRYEQRLVDRDLAPFGYERVVGANADIGAFETGAPDRIFMDTFER